MNTNMTVAVNTVVVVMMVMVAIVYMLHFFDIKNHRASVKSMACCLASGINLPTYLVNTEGY